MDWDRVRDGVRVTISKYLRSYIHGFQEALFGRTVRYSAALVSTKNNIVIQREIFSSEIFFVKSTI